MDALKAQIIPNGFNPGFNICITLPNGQGAVLNETFDHLSQAQDRAVRYYGLVLFNDKNEQISD